MSGMHLYGCPDSKEEHLLHAYATGAIREEKIRDRAWLNTPLLKA
jgi:hypothetical protein